MAKSKERILKPDDPIFTGGPQIFVPVSRPLTHNANKKRPPKRPSTKEEKERRE